MNSINNYKLKTLMRIKKGLMKILQYIKTKVVNIASFEEADIVDTELNGRLTLTKAAMTKLKKLKEENSKILEKDLCFLFLSKNNTLPDMFKIIDVEEHEELVQLEQKIFSDYVFNEHVKIAPYPILNQNSFSLKDDRGIEYYLDFGQLLFQKFYKDLNNNIYKESFNSISSLTVSMTEQNIESQNHLIKTNKKFKIPESLSSILEVSSNIKLTYSDILALMATYDLSTQYHVQNTLLKGM